MASTLHKAAQIYYYHLKIIIITIIIKLWIMNKLQVQVAAKFHTQWIQWKPILHQHTLKTLMLSQCLCPQLIIPMITIGAWRISGLCNFSMLNKIKSYLKKRTISIYIYGWYLNLKYFIILVQYISLGLSIYSLEKIYMYIFPVIYK